MKTKFIASIAALSSAVSLGAVGVAGASGPSGGHPSQADRVAALHAVAMTKTLPSDVSCSVANRLLGRIAAAEQRLPSIEAKLEAAATAAAGTPRAARVQARLATAQQVASDLPVVASVILSSCPGASSSSPTAVKVAGRVEAVHALLADVHQIATSGVLPAGFSCTVAPAVQHHLTGAEGKLDGRLVKLRADQGVATAAGKTAKAAAMAARITKLSGVRADLVAVSGLVTAACAA